MQVLEGTNQTQTLATFLSFSQVLDATIALAITTQAWAQMSPWLLKKESYLHHPSERTQTTKSDTAKSDTVFKACLLAASLPDGVPNLLLIGCLACCLLVYALHKIFIFLLMCICSLEAFWKSPHSSSQCRDRGCSSRAKH